MSLSPICIDSNATAFDDSIEAATTAEAIVAHLFFCA
jgi:hypothetical protein